MKSTKETKSVKTPLYALTKGSGVFAGAKWMCTKCGKQITSGSSVPSPQSGGKCPDTNSGNHIWQQC